MKRLLAMFGPLALFGCVTPALVIPTTGATCATACDRARALQCEYAADFEGMTCEAVCENTQASKVLRFDLECRSTAATCEAAEKCEVD
jgi:hypothetical protein